LGGPPLDFGRPPAADGHRMTTRRERRNLDALYAEMPTLDCKGKCAESCGPIVMSRVEWARLTETVGYEPKGTADLTCPLLDGERCSVYAIRPTICRLWGMVEAMPCEWGCQPSRILTNREGFAFLERAGELGA
jgi:Fe-S-cluster containining protein